MKTINLNPIVEGLRSELTFNQILCERNSNTGKITLFELDCNGVVVPITPVIAAVNDTKDIVFSDNDNEFKTAFEAFYNNNSNVKTSAIGMKLYAWKADNNVIYTNVSKIVAEETSIYDNAGNAVEGTITKTSGKGVSQTIVVDSVTYTRSTDNDIEIQDFTNLFNILKSYLPVNGDSIHNPNAVNVYGCVNPDTDTVKASMDAKYISVQFVNDEYVITKGSF